MAGIQKLQDYKIIINPNCEHTIIEFSNYCWDTDSKTGQILDKPTDDYNHCIDAIRYAIEELTRKKNKAKVYVGW